MRGTPMAGTPMAHNGTPRSLVMCGLSIFPPFTTQKAAPATLPHVSLRPRGLESFVRVLDAAWHVAVAKPAIAVFITLITPHVGGRTNAASRCGPTSNSRLGWYRAASAENLGLSQSAMITLTKPGERNGQRPAHSKVDGARTWKSLGPADRAQFRVACASW